MTQAELTMLDVTPLSAPERAELQYHESGMDQNEAEYIAHLQAIHDKKLYREYGTFDEYCVSRRGFTANYARKILRATEVRANLESGTTVPFLPNSERQIRPLTQLEPEDQPVVWQRAIETAPNGKVTAAHVEQTVREWKQDDQEVFTDPEADEYQEIVERRKAAPQMAVHFTSDTPEWYTPDKVIERVIDVFGQIDLDPCSNSDNPDTANVPARHYYTAQTDGLAHHWFGKVYMNPPYGDEIGPWVEKLVSEFTAGRVVEAIALVPARTDTNWIQPLYDYALCFIRGRLKFKGAENGAPFPSLVVYLGPDKDLFMDCFEQIGRTGCLR